MLDWDVEVLPWKERGVTVLRIYDKRKPPLSPNYYTTTVEKIVEFVKESKDA